MRKIRSVALAGMITLAGTATLAAGCTADPAPRAQAGPVSPTPSTPAAPSVDYAAWDAGRSAPVADPLYPKVGTAAIDVLHYGLELDWAPKTKTLTGTATLRIRPTVDNSELSLDFLPYEIDGITLDGAPVTGAVTGQKLKVPADVVADKPVTLEVRYHGTPKTVAMPSKRGDFDEGLGLRAIKDGSLWTMQEPYGALTWYPSNDHPSDEALYDIAVTVPKGWSAIASGTPAGGGEQRPEGTTFRYTSADPVATYLVTLAAGVYSKVSAKGPRGVPLTYWYRPKKDKKLLAVMKKSPSYLTWLERKLGPHPFPTAGAVIVESESAMETQQMVTFGGKLDPEYAPLVMVHEYAHQWFGNAVTPKTWTDLWLNEGWAQYMQYLYDIEDRDIAESALESFLRERDAALRKELGPPGKPKAGRFAESNVYVCTAAMLHELHDALGDKKFFALARAWVQENRNTQQDRASFIAFVNKQTGKNFSPLINAWLDSKKTPR